MTNMDTSTNMKYSQYSEKRNGILFCEEVSIPSLQQELATKFETASPLFIYSKAQLLDNVRAYKTALEKAGMDYLVGYAMKANCNPTICDILFKEGCGAVTVSGNEIKLALSRGLDPSKIVFNGNGKQIWEITLAVTNGCMLNVDSYFDLKHIIDVCTKTGKKANILIRINPNIDPNVHPFLATGLSSSKFGLEECQLDNVLKTISKHPEVILIGLHCHLGSTIDNVKVFQESVEIMLKLVEMAKKQGFSEMKYLNIGGGLGIDYKKHFNRTSPDLQIVIDKLKNSIDKPNEVLVCLDKFQQNGGTIDSKTLSYMGQILKKETLQELLENTKTNIPIAPDLIQAVSEMVKKSNLSLILEPGRSLVGNAGILATKVIGCKKNGNINHIIVDGSMNEVIGPSLYGAYHHIDLAEPSQSNTIEKQTFNIVGPICECADFLGKYRHLVEPHEGCALAVFDTGAYCASKLSSYNMRLKPAEVLVDKDKWEIIRQPGTYEDLI